MKLYPHEVPALVELQRQYRLTCSQLAAAHKSRTGRGVSRETIRRAILRALKRGDDAQNCADLPT